MDPEETRPLLLTSSSGGGSSEPSARDGTRDRSPRNSTTKPGSKSPRKWHAGKLVVATVAVVALWLYSRSMATMRLMELEEGRTGGRRGRSSDGGAEWRRWSEVPLDWLDPSDPRRATIAIIRYNATDLTSYAGPVFINPGGPGGSGVWFVRHLAPYYQSIIGKNHDIVSFDPRGVGFTTPQVSCWNASASSPSPSPYLWDLLEPPVLDAHPGVIYDAYAYATAFSQQCFSQISDVGAYVNTAPVARDMLHMVEKLAPAGEAKPKLKYWGFSYGTFLGVTFASMFPERVGRMVNDGNVDARDYVSGQSTHFLTDTDRVMDAFYVFCHRAGPDRCDFYAESPAAIEARLELLLEDIKKHPVIVPASPPRFPRPEIVSYSGLRRLISSALYQPLLIFPSLASTLLALESGDGRPFVNLTSQGAEEPSRCYDRLESTIPTEPENPTPGDPEGAGSADASKAILCADLDPVQGGVDDFVTYVDKLVRLSAAAGASMASLVMGCVGWQVKAKWRFSGPFEANTSHPILFIANTADNVTPLRSALANAAGFPGSVVMIQDSYGHTTLSTPSRCTASTIRSYFQDGTLPAPDTTCAPDLVPFEPWSVDSAGFGLATTSDPGMEDEENLELDLAMVELMMAPVPGMGRYVRG
ncbi:alpha beta hydrolase fold family [Drepanopeziza brunnea f. sp. 'multigermtubi' MB_m1]|uniref:Alpha beta hydrolase fold family n=1 Tax=Marssonina brunnea f. sp. multigermtubi (strain MB_m1) TaxID=1072389 RepID=K1Y564_MARBU|nr:alpha beta hydrolase fold family [Drepanopeziza brunnea f. sp. 'multigermtubi' MB_m1]EKD20304.1 alpha beta hydrolase fold family [Drepanopeziza brunnea f. sp. 'multigermtubi' MB_m1]